MMSVTEFESKPDGPLGSRPPCIRLIFALNAVSRSLSLPLRLIFTIFVVGLALHTLASISVASDLYVVYGARGSVTFTSRKPEGADRRFSVFVPKRGGVSRIFTNAYHGIGNWNAKVMESRFDNLIYGMANLYDLDPALVKAVVHVESAFNPQATSHCGAMGLMQLMPGTAERFGVAQPYTPEENVRGGVTYLKMLYDRYSGDVRLALAAYNAGEGLVDQRRAIPQISETQQYVRRVMMMRERYRCAIDGRKDC